VVAALLVVSTMLGSIANGLAADPRGGGVGAAPSVLVPATADLYLELNTSLGQGAAVQQMWKAYLSHPGTAAAVKRLINDPQGLGLGGIMPQVRSMLSFAGPRVGLALWVTTKPNAKGRPTSSVSDISIVAQLKPSALLNNAAGPQSALGTFTPVGSYRGVTLFKIGNDGGTFGALFAGDGVVANSLDGVRRAIDAGTFSAPNLAGDTAFAQTTSSLPSVRLVTLYMTPKFLAGGQSLSQAAGLGLVPAGSLAKAAAMLRPMAYAVVAAPDGLEMVSSAISGSTMSATPNQGAGIVGNSAVLYLSVNDLAAALMGSGVVDPKLLRQLQAQTGLSFQQDIAPLVSHEVVIDINDEVSPIVSQITQPSSSSGAGTVPVLPGSLELATWVDSPAVAQRAVLHLIAAVLRATQSGQSGGSTTFVLEQRTLPDGSVAYTVPGLPSVGYTIRGHWLIVSSNLDGDMTAAKVPLAGDAEYQAALGHVSNGGALAGVSYLNLGRLWKMVGAWLRFSDLLSRSQGQQSQATAEATWKQVGPLLAPLRNAIGVTRIIAPGSYQAATFITIKP
jgi:hypothetical protein